MSTQGKLRYEITAENDNFVAALDEVRKSTKKTFAESSDGARIFANVLRNEVQTAMVLIGGALGVGAVKNYADAWTEVSNRLATSGTATEDIFKKQQDILDVANRSKSSLAETADLYAKISLNADRLKLTEEQRLKLTENLTKSFSISGASTSAREGAVGQVGQGLGGVFQAEELDSLIDANPVATQALLKEFAVETTQELKKLASEGKVTAERVAVAFLAMGADIEVAYAKSETTISQAFTVLENNLTALIGQMDDATGTSETLSALIIALAENIDDVAKVVGISTVAIAGFYAPSVLTGLATLRTAVLAVNFGAMLNPIGLVAAAVAGLATTWLLYRDNVTEVDRVSQNLNKTNSDVKNMIEDVKNETLKLNSASAEERKEITKKIELKKAEARMRADNALQIANENLALAKNQLEIKKLKRDASIRGFASSGQEFMGATDADLEGFEQAKKDLAQAQKDLQVAAKNMNDVYSKKAFIPKETPTGSGGSTGGGKTGTNSKPLLSPKIKISNEKTPAQIEAEKMAKGNLQIEQIITDNQTDRLENARELINNTKTAQERYNDELERMGKLEPELIELLGSKDKAQKIIQQNLADELDAIKQVKEAETEWQMEAVDSFTRAITSARSFEEALMNIAMTIANDLVPEIVKMSSDVDSVFGGAKNQGGLGGYLVSLGMDLATSIGTAYASGGMGGGNVTVGENVSGGTDYNFGSHGTEGFGGFRAKGGGVSSNMAYMVGEQGQELFIPDTDGYILPNNITNAISGIGKLNSGQSTVNNSNITIPITVNTPDVTSFKKSQNQMYGDALRAIKSARGVI